MKRFVTALALLLMMVAPALGLSDSEYRRMRMNNKDFFRADKRLNQVFAKLRRNLPASVFSQLEKLQREWVRSGRDDEALALMDEGYSRTEAYTAATNDRADALPKIAEELRESRSSNKPQTPARRNQTRNEEPEPESPRRNRPVRTQTPDPEPEPEPKTQPASTPEPVPEPEPEAAEKIRASDIEGEYQNNTGFISVRITDINTDEMEVTFSRFKDGVHWTSKGWLDGNTLELSDSNYSECQATLTFSRGTVKVKITDTDDWVEATSPDFVLEGTYKKLAM